MKKRILLLAICLLCTGCSSPVNSRPNASVEISSASAAELIEPIETDDHSVFEASEAGDTETGKGSIYFSGSSSEYDFDLSLWPSEETDYYLP